MDALRMLFTHHRSRKKKKSRKTKKKAMKKEEPKKKTEATAPLKTDGPPVQKEEEATVSSCTSDSSSGAVLKTKRRRKRVLLARQVGAVEMDAPLGNLRCPVDAHSPISRCDPSRLQLTAEHRVKREINGPQATVREVVAKDHAKIVVYNVQIQK